jgi:cytochrome bd-type quinol oxidase subunit 1
MLDAFVVGILRIGNEWMKHGRVTFQQNQNVQRASQSRSIIVSIFVFVVFVICLKPIWLMLLYTYTHKHIPRFVVTFARKGRERAPNNRER